MLSAKDIKAGLIGLEKQAGEKGVEQFEQKRKKELILKKIEAIRKDIKKGTTNIVKPPLDVFPDVIANIMKKHQAMTQLPADYYLSNLLAAISTAIGNGYQISVMDGWLESTILWLTTIGPPSFGKTPVTKAVLDPLHYIQDELNNKYDALKTATLTNGMDMDNFVEPNIYTRGGTMEGFKSTLAVQPRGMMMLLDEIMVLINSMDAYRSGKGADMDNWIRLWENGEIKDTLSGSTRRVKRAWITINGNIQPGRLASLASKSQTDSGFTARLLFCYPHSIIRQPVKLNQGLNDNEKKVYRSIFRFMYDLPSRIHTPQLKTQPAIFDPTTLRFEEEAFKVFYKYHQQCIGKYNSYEEDHLKAAVGKFDRYCARLALILQLLEFSCDNHENAELQEKNTVADMENNIKVTKKNAQGAVKLMRYFEYTTLKVYDRLDNPLKSLTSEWELIMYKMLEDNFETNDAKEIAKIGFDKSPETVKKVLAKWIQKKIVSKPGGRRSQYEKLC